MFIFDESLQTLTERARSLGCDLTEHVAAGRVDLRPVDPAELSPGEFAHRIRVAVEEQDVRIVVIDSLNGYLNAMPTERYLIIQLHELLSYLGQKGVATIITAAHRGLIGSHMESPVDATDLADLLVKAGVPFRKAHERVGAAVRSAIELGVELSALPAKVQNEHLPELARVDLATELSVDAVLSRRSAIGGTAPSSVASEINTWKERLRTWNNRL